jgi:hypothetical protein
MDADKCRRGSSPAQPDHDGVSKNLHCEYHGKTDPDCLILHLTSPVPVDAQQAVDDTQHAEQQK